MTDYVTRPDVATNGRPTKYPYKELMATLENGQALMIPVGVDTNCQLVRSVLAQYLSRRNLRLRSLTTDQGLTAWVVRKA